MPCKWAGGRIPQGLYCAAQSMDCIAYKKLRIEMTDLQAGMHASPYLGWMPCTKGPSFIISLTLLGGDHAHRYDRLNTHPLRRPDASACDVHAAKESSLCSCPSPLLARPDRELPLRNAILGATADLANLPSDCLSATLRSRMSRRMGP